MATPSAIQYSSLASGQTVGPAQHRFLLQHKTADSLFGQLWQAQDLSAQGTPIVTLEFIQPALIAQSTAIDAIKRSVTYGKKLRHKHLTLLYGFFQSENQPVFLSAERLDATTLADLLAGGKLQALSDNQIKGLLLQIAAGLDTAYSSQHLNHSSLCPACIHINRGSGVKLSGFATFPAHDYLDATRAHTQRYDLYQAPETHKNQNRNRAADIFSVACISYEILTGHPPFATTQETTQCDPLRLSQPEPLTQQQWHRLQAALSSDPSDRPATALVLIKSLFQADETMPDTDPTPATESADSIGEESDDTQATTSRLSEADLTPQNTVVTLNPTTEDNGETDHLQKKRRILPLMTFAAGILIGYLASLIFVTSPMLDVTANPILPDQPADQKKTTTDTEPASLDTPDNNLVQATVSESGIVSEPSTLPDTDTAVSLAAKLTQSQAPRTLLFRDQIKGELYGPDMVVLPSGKFRMGDNHEQGDDNERPVRTVTIEQPFALSRYEVTFAQYDAFVRATRRNLPADDEWGRGTRPVINISWQDAQDYVRWLAKQTDQPYRLPTEAEWEYAARAGTQTAFSWGNKPLQGFAVCDECGSEWDGNQTAPVGSQQANPWGLYDMAGNVSEWVADCYTPDYQGAPDNSAARDTDGCNDRVMRGGSWFDIMRLMRPAGRYRHPARATQNDWGFRVALDLPEQFIKENNQ